jgi:hypothetical protein
MEKREISFAVGATLLMAFAWCWRLPGLPKTYKAVGGDEIVYEVGRRGTNAADARSCITNHTKAYLPRVALQTGQGAGHHPGDKTSLPQ